MFRKTWFRLMFAIILVLVVGKIVSIPGNGQGLSMDQAKSERVASTITSAFTYQGELTESGNPANGSYDFEFTLFDAVNGGLQVGSPVTKEDEAVANGLFTVEIDFGNVFDGTAVWLEIAVRSGSSTGNYTTLTPRQTLTAVPYATFAGHSVWSGLVDVPADLADGDDDTTYTAGFGLEMNGTQFDVDTTVVQSRVSGACAVGQTIQAIQADGTVVCQSTVDTALAARQAYSHNIVDQSGDVGNDSSITIGIDGLPIIAHYAADDGDLKVSHCNDLACTSATWTLVDTAGGEEPAITIGIDGLPLISYAAIDYTLRVAHCHDLLCNSADISIVDDVGNHSDSSIAIGADGLGLISYQDWTNDLLQVAHCENLVCSQVTTSTLDGPFGNGGWYNSLAIGVDGLGLISYYDASLDDLKVAHCSDLVCSSATITTLDSAGDVGSGSSLAIGADGRGIISHLDQNGEWLKVSHCNNLTCSSAATSNVDWIGDVRPFNKTSIAIGSDGLPLIAHFSSSSVNIRVAHCVTPDCQNGVTVSILPVVGVEPSIVIGTDGLPLIAFRHYSWDRLEVVRTVLGRGTPYR